MKDIFLVECYFTNIISFLRSPDNINLLITSKNINNYIYNNLLWENITKKYLKKSLITKPDWVKSHYQLYIIYYILNKKRNTCPICFNKEHDNTYYLLLCKCYKKNKDIVLSNGSRIYKYILHHKKCIEHILGRKLNIKHSINNKCIYCSEKIFYFPIKNLS